MLITVGDTSAKPAAEESLGQLFKSVAILRIGSGLVLAWFHGWPGARSAYQFLWKEQPWEWVGILGKANIPYPHLVAPAAALVIAAVCISWTLGFVTRLFSAAFIPVAIGGMIVAHRLESSQIEACALYLPIAFTLLLFGSGNISLDFFFHLGQKAKEPSKRR